MKPYPPTMSLEQALRAGLLGRLTCRPYLDWLKTLPCDTCGAGAPSDPSHYNGYKGTGTKSPDGMAIPQCRRCHDVYERGPARYAPDPNENFAEVGDPFLERAAIYMAVWIAIHSAMPASEKDDYDRLERELAEANERDAALRISLKETHAKLAEARKDAERYQWLRKYEWDLIVLPDFIARPSEDGEYAHSQEQLDAAIDAAMKGKT